MSLKDTLFQLESCFRNHDSGNGTRSGKMLPVVSFEALLSLPKNDKRRENRFKTNANESSTDVWLDNSNNLNELELKNIVLNKMNDYDQVASKHGLDSRAKILRFWTDKLLSNSSQLSCKKTSFVTVSQL